MKPPLDQNIHFILNECLKRLEDHFEADILAYCGNITDGIENEFLRIIEGLDDEKKRGKIYIILTTTGGSAVAVERYVNILRNFYEEVNFIVPDYAYSAGTIFCMSGDNILMDFFSVLGPIDPQVPNKDGRWVPALGYLDKVNEFIEKSAQGNLTQAEFLLLKDLDLATLRSYEQAKNLTIDLLKRWLVKYKFKNWTLHSSGKEVTEAEKQERAREIADMLSDSNRWKSHGRPINIAILTEELHLRIDDYSNNKERRDLIRNYYGLLSDYVKLHGIRIFVHTRNYIN